VETPFYLNPGKRVNVILEFFVNLFLPGATCTRGLLQIVPTPVAAAVPAAKIHYFRKRPLQIKSSQATRLPLQ
jgi:hypothetical protein